MKMLKSERHHWWPECVSRHWAAEDGKAGWVKRDGSCIRIRPDSLGVISNGHHIKIGKNGAPSPWDQSFERAFDKADSSFPELIRWLEGLKRSPVPYPENQNQRFMAQTCTDEELIALTECVVSLAVRGPMNRAASVALAEKLRGPIDKSERNVLIGVNMRDSQRIVADSIGARAKFVAVYSPEREFLFGDGFFHNVSNAQMAPQSPKLFAPITPNIAVLICRPYQYAPEPKLVTLVLEGQEADACNQAVQVYSKNAIYFRSQQPLNIEHFLTNTHEQYIDLNNPIDNIIRTIPGIPPAPSLFGR